MKKIIIENLKGLSAKKIVGSALNLIKKIQQRKLKKHVSQR